jgi:hypothetical protein
MDVNRAVRIIVKIVRADQEGDFVTSLREQEKAADHRALGFDGSRRLAIEQLVQAGPINRGGFAKIGALLFIDCGHENRSVDGRSAIPGRHSLPALAG